MPAIIWMANKLGFSVGKWKIVRSFYPYIIALLGYKESAYFVQIIFPRWFDDALVAIDYSIFGVHPTIWLPEHGNLFLNECANFFYFSYFVYVPVLVYYFWKHKPALVYEGFMGGIVMAYSFSYIFFALIPASSPRFALPEFGLIASEDVRLNGYFFTAVIDMFMDKGAMRGGAFPSVHCCVSTVYLLNVYRYTPRKVFILSIIMVFGMYWSTVYGRYHYVIDVITGISLGLLFDWSARRCQARIQEDRTSCNFSKSF